MNNRLLTSRPWRPLRLYQEQRPCVVQKPGMVLANAALSRVVTCRPRVGQRWVINPGTPNFWSQDSLPSLKAESQRRALTSRVLTNFLSCNAPWRLLVLSPSTASKISVHNRYACVVRALSVCAVPYRPARTASRAVLMAIRASLRGSPLDCPPAGTCVANWGTAGVSPWVRVGVIVLTLARAV